MRTDGAYPFFTIVMGVSGSGKTLIGKALAKAINLPFLDADQLHPSSNIEKMRAGIPLSDQDRLAWLQAVNLTMVEHERNAVDEGGIIIACSALKVKYRRILRGFTSDYNLDSKLSHEDPGCERRLHFLYLSGGYDALSLRVQSRRDHFMPPSLLRSQFEALEEPTEEEQIDGNGINRGKLVRASIHMEPDEIVSLFLKQVL